MLDIQHPVITEIEKYGYPSWVNEQETIYCDMCEKRLDDPYEIYEDLHNDYLCEECLKKLHAKGW